MAGYAHTEVDYQNSPNQSWMDGWTGGLYASLISGNLFVDAALNANKLVMYDDVPALDLFPDGTILSTDLLSVGGQIEAGWRFALGQGLFVEPLATVSYVRTTYGELLIPADDPARPRVGIEFDDPTSLRASLGARASLDNDHGAFRTQLSLLGRLWNEFEGENGVALTSQGPDALILDEFTGQFSEFNIGGAIYSGGGAVTGFVNLGGKFGDDYNATTAAGGVRINW